MKNMVHTTVVMQKNIGLLLDDLYDKDGANKRRTEEIRQKIMQYSAGGLHFTP